MIIRNNKQLHTSGFTLVEVMAAVTILSIGLIGSLNLINYNLRNISFQKNKIIASGLVEDGMERVRNIRDTNWLNEKNEEEGVDAWDKDISGKGAIDEGYIRFFCGDNSLYKEVNPKPDGANENSIIDDCADSLNKCKLYIYSNGPLKCYGDDFGSLKNGYTGVQYIGFYRLIHITELTANSNKVSVTVRWVEGGQNKYLTATEILYNWK